MARHVRRSPEKLPANRVAMEKFELCVCMCVLSIPSRFTLADAKVKLLRARTAEASTPEGPYGDPRKLGLFTYRARQKNAKKTRRKNET